MYELTCCTQECLLTNEVKIPVSLDAIFITFQDSEFTLLSEEYFYQGNPITSYPVFIAPDESVTVRFSYCASGVGNTDNLNINTEQNGGEFYQYSFSFESIDLTTTLDETAVDFGTVNVNSVNQFQITIDNPTACCYNYLLSTDCEDTSVFPEETERLCFGSTEVITITWTPIAPGTLDCNLSFIVPMGPELLIPITGIAEAAPPGPGGGWSNGQKNKVDQTTRVEACSPRSANNRCQTAKSMQNAIRTNARRFGKR
jgi:hypothetical protein